MSDFCKQCTERLTGKSTSPNDLSDLITQAQSEHGLYARAICEGCGPTFVDTTGTCMSKDCNKAHGDW